MDAKTALIFAKIAEDDIEAIMSRAPVRDQPREQRKAEADDVIGAIALFLFFVVLFAVPWGM